MDKYKKESDFSYTFGIFPTFELIKKQSKYVQKILIHEKLKISDDIEKLLNLCKQKNIVVEKCSKQIEKITDKENTLIVGVFSKYQSKIQNGNHVVLNNPSDMGNLGTIFRTCLGFNIKNIAIISPCADIFNPKTIRASMGAIFSLNIEIFESFDEYYNKFKNNNIYTFMLKGTSILQNINEIKSPYSLVFGNEGCGLDDSFLNIGTSVLIQHSNEIDSLNLPISVSIALYEFNKKA